MDIGNLLVHVLTDLSIPNMGILSTYDEERDFVTEWFGKSCVITEGEIELEKSYVYSYGDEGNFMYENADVIIKDTETEEDIYLVLIEG